MGKLQDIFEILEERHIISSRELELQLNLSSGQLKSLLEILQEQNLIELNQEAKSCDSNSFYCSSCSKGCSKVYTKANPDTFFIVLK